MADLKAQDSSIAKCIELLSETAEQAAEAFRHQDECPELEQADADLRELIDAQAEKAIRKSVLMEIVQDLQAGVVIACITYVSVHISLWVDLLTRACCLLLLTTGRSSEAIQR